MGPDARKHGVELKTSGEIAVEEDPSDAQPLAAPAAKEGRPLFRHHKKDKDIACCISSCPNCPTAVNVGQPRGMPN
jgi:hypothetical protein